MNPLIQRFADYLVGERHAPKNTYEAYLRDLSDFETFCKTDGLAQNKKTGVVELETITKDHIRMYVFKLHSDYSTATINRKLSSIRKFYKFLQREQVVSSNPARSVPSPKRSNRLPVHLEIDEAFAIVQRPKGDMEIRDTALFELLYSTGARVSEISEADCQAVDQDFEAIKVLGKGGKERITPIGEKARVALKAYFMQRSQGENPPTPDAPLFLNTRGNRLSRQSIYHIVKKAGLALTKNVSPHVMRHSFATHMLESGAGIREIQELLGHSNPSTTVRYTHVSLKKLAEEYDKAHPHGYRATKERKD